jgi:sacsin
MSFVSGIGFKSVFLISSEPHIFSNGYQIKFNEKPCAECNIGYIVPELVQSTPSLSDIVAIYGCSKSYLQPLNSEKVDAVKKQLSSTFFMSKMSFLHVEDQEAFCPRRYL